MDTQKLIATAQAMMADSKGLRERLKACFAMGARFAKWRAVQVGSPVSWPQRG